MFDHPFRLPRRTPAQQTPVPCPGCRVGTLLVYRSCLSISFSCASCQGSYELGDLARTLDEEAFEALESFVNDRLSDRI